MPVIFGLWEPSTLNLGHPGSGSDRAESGEDPIRRWGNLLWSESEEAVSSSWTHTQRQMAIMITLAVSSEPISLTSVFLMLKRILKTRCS